jgi:hypothetical protein
MQLRLHHINPKQHAFMKVYFYPKYLFKQKQNNLQSTDIRPTLVTNQQGIINKQTVSGKLT